MHVRMHVRMHTYIYVCIGGRRILGERHACMYACRYVYIQVFMHTCMYAYMYVCIHVCMHTYMYADMYCDRDPTVSASRP